VRHAEQRIGLVIAAVAIALAAASCANDSAPVNYLPSVSSFSKTSLAFGEGSRASAVTSQRPVGPTDLVNADGQCASLAPQPSAAPDQAAEPAAEPGLLPGGIGLEMTECDVVRRAGTPDNFEFGTNERGDRSLTLTYINGPRPGIYRFVAGRLASIERGPAPPTPAKPKKPAPKKPGPA
jgi:hypothetical protein